MAASGCFLIVFPIALGVSINLYSHSFDPKDSTRLNQWRERMWWSVKLSDTLMFIGWIFIATSGGLRSRLAAACTGDFNDIMFYYVGGIGLFMYPTILFITIYVVREAYHDEPVMATVEADTRSDISKALDTVNSEYGSLYAKLFEDAQITVDQLPQLTEDHLVKYLNIPLGHALELAAALGDRKYGGLGTIGIEMR